MEFSITGVGLYDRDGFRVSIGGFKLASVELVDPQTIVAWTRPDEPGEPGSYELTVSYDSGLRASYAEGFVLY